MDQMGTRPRSAGWRVDRRTFLKALGLTGVALAAGARFPMLDLSPPRALAATSPIDALALALEFDVERIYRFVAEQIRYEPYAGALRGAEGTLVARAGNSADQAVLLGALLRASGIECRYAEGAIDDSTAGNLLASAITDVATGSQEIVEAISGRGEGGRPFTTEPDAEVRARVEAALPDAERVTNWARTALTESVSMIQAALGEAGIELPPAGAEVPASERDGHLWIQAATGQDWLDLDPSLPGALMGDVVATVARTHDSLPDSLRHLVTIAIVAETVAGDNLVEATLAETSEFADVLAGKPIAVLNIERQGLKALGADIASGLEGGTTYVPCVVLGDTVEAGPGAIRFGGGERPEDPFAGLDAASPSSLEGEPTAEWVQVTVASPGADPVVIRREIFDRLGPDARERGVSDLSTLPPAELTQLEPEGPLDYIPAQRSHWLTVHTGTVGGEALERTFQSSELEATLTNVGRLYQVIREGANAELGLPSGVKMYPDAPNVVAFTVDPGLDEAQGLEMRSTLDIWHRSFGVLPVDGVEAIGDRGIVAGVLSHVAERLLVGEASPEVAATGSVVSVGAVFDKARADGLGIRVLREPEDVGSLPYAPDTLARLRASLEGGWLAVAPDREVRIGDGDRVGWWLVDPLTGRTVDQMDDGGGEGIPGYLTIEYGNFRASINIRRMATCGAWLFYVAAMILAAYGGIYLAATSGGGIGSAAGAVVTGAAVGAAGGVGIPAYRAAGCG